MWQFIQQWFFKLVRKWYIYLLLFIWGKVQDWIYEVTRDFFVGKVDIFVYVLNFLSENSQWYAWYFVPIILVVLLVVTYVRTKSPILSNLRELYGIGVGLRNEGMRINTEAQVEPWIDKVDEWNRKVISNIEQKSVVEATTFETLDLMPPREFQSVVNERHLLYLRVLTEKLQRLIQIMRRL
jgi:hypothetical protein